MLRIRHDYPENPPEQWNALTPAEAWKYLRFCIQAERFEADRIEAALQEETQAAAHWRKVASASIANERGGR